MTKTDIAIEALMEVLGKLINQGSEKLVKIYEQGSYIISRDIKLITVDKQVAIENTDPIEYETVQEVS